MKIDDYDSWNVLICAKDALRWDLISSVAWFVAVLKQLILHCSNTEKKQQIGLQDVGKLALKCMCMDLPTTNSWEMVKTQRGSHLSLFVTIAKWCQQKFIQTGSTYIERFTHVECVWEKREQKN